MMNQEPKVDRLLQNFEQNRRSRRAEELVEGQNSDIILKVQDREFQAHKLLLTARSPVFSCMFSHDMVERGTGIVNINDCTAEAFGILLLFIYTGKVDKLTAENACSVYYASDKYCIDDLKDHIRKFFQAKISINNCYDVLHLSVLHHDLELQRLATSFYWEYRTTVKMAHCQKYSKATKSIKERRKKKLLEVDRLLQKFEQLLVEGQNSDIILKVQNREFPAHKGILMARSPVFSCMFSHNMVERGSRVVNIDNCSAKAFEVLLLFIYTGSVGTLTAENAFSVYYASNNYCIDDLKDHVLKFLTSNLSVENCCGLFSISMNHQLDLKLQILIDTFFLRKICDITQTTAWKMYFDTNMLESTRLIARACQELKDGKIKFYKNKTRKN